MQSYEELADGFLAECKQNAKEYQLGQANLTNRLAPCYRLPWWPEAIDYFNEHDGKNIERNGRKGSKENFTNDVFAKRVYQYFCTLKQQGVLQQFFQHHKQAKTLYDKVLEAFEERPGEVSDNISVLSNIDLPIQPVEVPLPEEIADTGNLVEGAVRTVTINAYERNPEARQRCIAAHGSSCCICGFNFGAVYGSDAEGYIHVHHILPLSEIGCEYVVDPFEDLRPVCPNCHAVLHLGGKCRSLEEVWQLLNQQQ
jgi:hypothetical protein